MKKTIVIRVDGGICAQIAFVSMGMNLAAKFGEAVVVKYDLSWYRDWGKDLDGLQVRNWDFPKAFPYVPCEEASPEEIRRLMRWHKSKGRNVENFRPPLYIGGYPDRYPGMCRLASVLRGHFRPQLDEVSVRWLDEIARGHVCAVHVRRGDLAAFNPAYGKPATAEYFSRAIGIVRSIDPEAEFLFFSDDPAWVRNELFASLPGNVRKEVVEGHDSSVGYQDLYLISKCRHVISSSGSLGVFGAVLAEDCRTLVMNRNREYAFKYLKNVIYLNDSYHEEGLPGVSSGGGWLRRLWRTLRNGRRVA